MRKFITLLVIAVTALTSCKHEYEKAAGGTIYIKYTNNDGPKIKDGDFVAVNIIAKTDLDSLIGNTYEFGFPKVVIVRPFFKGDFQDALKLMTTGDSLSVKMDDDSIFKKGPRPASFKGKYIIYTMKVQKVIPKGKMTDKELQAKAWAYIGTLTTVLKKEEPVKIKKYIDDNKLNAAKTDSGLYYVINKKGEGPLAVAGDTVVINYTAGLTNGKIFDTNIKADALKAKLPPPAIPYNPIRIPVGQKRVIPGWDQGFLLLNKGAHATFIIPSKLAYDADGHIPVGPYCPLFTYIEVVDIIHHKPGAVNPAKK